MILSLKRALSIIFLILALVASAEPPGLQDSADSRKDQAFLKGYEVELKKWGLVGMMRFFDFAALRPPLTVPDMGRLPESIFRNYLASRQALEALPEGLKKELTKGLNLTTPLSSAQISEPQVKLDFGEAGIALLKESKFSVGAPGAELVIKRAGALGGDTSEGFQLSPSGIWLPPDHKLETPSEPKKHSLRFDGLDIARLSTLEDNLQTGLGAVLSADSLVTAPDWEQLRTRWISYLRRTSPNEKLTIIRFNYLPPLAKAELFLKTPLAPPLKEGLSHEELAILKNVSWQRESRYVEFRTILPYDKDEEYLRSLSALLRAAGVEDLIEHPEKDLTGEVVSYHKHLSNRAGRNFDKAKAIAARLAPDADGSSRFQAGVEITEILESGRSNPDFSLHMEAMNCLIAVRLQEQGTSPFAKHHTHFNTVLTDKGLLSIVSQGHGEFRAHTLGPREELREWQAYLRMPADQARKAITDEIQKSLKTEVLIKLMKGNWVRTAQILKFALAHASPDKSQIDWNDPELLRQIQEHEKSLDTLLDVLPAEHVIRLVDAFKRRGNDKFCRLVEIRVPRLLLEKYKKVDSSTDLEVMSALKAYLSYDGEEFDLLIQRRLNGRWDQLLALDAEVALQAAIKSDRFSPVPNMLVKISDERFVEALFNFVGSDRQQAVEQMLRLLERRVIFEELGEKYVRDLLERAGGRGSDFVLKLSRAFPFRWWKYQTYAESVAATSAAAITSGKLRDSCGEEMAGVKAPNRTVLQGGN
ncbi:MAG: hypothetical protein HY537_17850 [Deltaproteobacteria bacterium]|nr:hypothetical protein [Deltaproteobacteria bacterium]